MSINEIDKNAKYSDDYIDGADACSSYDSVTGKCLDNPQKYCDGCASEMMKRIRNDEF